MCPSPMPSITSLTRIGLGHCLNERLVAASNNGPSHRYQEVLVCALHEDIHTSNPVGLMKGVGGGRGCGVCE